METVNEELRIYKCHVGELAGKEVGKFLEKLPDTPLNKMTVIYDREKDNILVNQDSICSDAAIKVITLCLTGRGEEVGDYMYNHDYPSWLVEIITVADSVCNIRAVKEDYKAGKEMCAALDFGMNAGEAREIQKECDQLNIITKAFYIGVARGYKAGQRNT